MKRSIQYCTVLFFAGLLSLVPLYAQTELYRISWNSYGVSLSMRARTVYIRDNKAFFSGNTAILDVEAGGNAAPEETYSARLRVVDTTAAVVVDTGEKEGAWSSIDNTITGNELLALLYMRVKVGGETEKEYGKDIYIYRDQTAPVITILDTARINMPTAVITASATDKLSGVNIATWQYSINGGPWSAKGYANSMVTLNGYGSYTVSFRVEDNVGNYEIMTHEVELVDLPHFSKFRIYEKTVTDTASTGTVTADIWTDGKIYQDRTFLFIPEGAVIEVLSTLQGPDSFSLNVRLTNYDGSGYYLPNMSLGGRHLFAHLILEGVLNIELRRLSDGGFPDPHQRVIRQDRHVPVIKVGPPVENGTELVVTASAMDSSLGDPSGVDDDTWQYSINGGEWSAQSAANNSVTLTRAGVYTIAFRVQDNVGNQSTVSVSDIVQSDRIKPEISVDVNGNRVGDIWYINSLQENGQDRVEVSWEDIDSGIDETSAVYTVDGGNSNLFENFKVQEGSHIYVISVSDNAGNEQTETIQIVYDKTPYTADEISINWQDVYSETEKAAGNDSSIRGDIKHIRADVNQSADKPAGLAYIEWKLGDADGWSRFDAPAVKEGKSIIDTSTLAEGVHKLSIRAIDLAGNVSDPRKLDVIIDQSVIVPDRSWFSFTQNSNEFQLSESAVTKSMTELMYVYTVDSSGNTVQLWDGNRVTIENNNPKKTSYARDDNTGIATVLLMVKDDYGNRAEKEFIILHPDAPGTLRMEKQVLTDMEAKTIGFELLISEDAPAPVRTTYTVKGQTAEFVPVYRGIGASDEQGTAVSGAEAVTAATGVLDMNQLSKAGAFKSGDLRCITLWAEMIPGDTSQLDESIIIRKDITGLTKTYQIPNSPPVFFDKAEFPGYFSEQTAISVYEAKDPDGHSIQYRYRVKNGDEVFYTERSTEISAFYSLRFDKLRYADGRAADTAAFAEQAGRNGISVWFEAWDMVDGTADLSTEPGVIYTPGTFDNILPEIVPGEPLETVWNNRKWWNRDSFELFVQDSQSGIQSIKYSMIPLEEDGAISSGSRMKIENITYPITAGTKNRETLHIAVSPEMSGYYQIIITVQDMARNVIASEYYSGFDLHIPEIRGALISNTQNAGGNSYFADRTGMVQAAVDADGTGSGIAAWAYQEDGGEWIWTACKGSWISRVNIKPSWRTDTAVLRIRVRDYGGNESAPYDIGTVRYSRNAPEFTVSLEGVTGSAETGYYAGDRKLLDAEIVTEDSEAEEIGETEWLLIRESDSIQETAVGSAAKWAELRDNNELWVQGGRYHITVRGASRNGIESYNHSISFILDETPPEMISLRLKPSADGRSVYYAHEDFICLWEGGEDSESPVQKTLELYQTAEGVSKEIRTIEFGESGAFSTEILVSWGQSLNPAGIDWEKGGFYLKGTAVNRAGFRKESDPIPVSVSGNGLAVYVPKYIDGANPIAVSWTGTAEQVPADEEPVYYWQLWKDRQEGDIPLGEERSASENSALVSPGDPDSLETGDMLYVIVRAVNTEGAEISRGISISMTVDKSSPELIWKRVPEAAPSGRVRAEFSAGDGESGIRQTAWRIEKRLPDQSWIGISGSGDSTGGEWNKLSGDDPGIISVSLEGLADTGEIIRILLRAENETGFYSQITSEGITIDNTPPPVPVVIDQGAVVNHRKQPIEVNWRLSAVDSESGLEAYYWRWFYAGEADAPAVWQELEADSDAAVSIDLKEGRNGASVIVAVKAVNRAGVESTGFSDGIILDENAPFIHDISVYSDSSYAQLCEGYISSGVIKNGTVYIRINADEQESWVEGGIVYAYLLDDSGSRSYTGKYAALTADPVYGLTAKLSLGNNLIGGSSWIFEAEVTDKAGNISSRAASGGFIIEWQIPAIAVLNGRIDSRSIHLDWELEEADTSGGERFVRGYTVTASKNNGPLLFTRVAETRAVSFEWASQELNLQPNDMVTFTVSAFSYTNAQSAAETITIILDVTPPEYSVEESRIPFIDGVTHWYDRIDALAVYTGTRSGISSIQWSAVAVPGEYIVRDWEEIRGNSRVQISEQIDGLYGLDLEEWHGKRISLRFRAANGMGIWSGITSVDAVEIDTTVPEVMSIERSYLWTNERDGVNGWEIAMGDTQSGIISWQSVLVPEDTDMTAFSWTPYEVYPAYTQAGAEEKLTDVRVVLSDPGEGVFIPFLRVRNGSGRWITARGTAIIVDRTAPELTDAVWPGTSPGMVVSEGSLMELPVSNGPEQEYRFTADEDVRWKVSGDGEWFAEQYPGGEAFAAAAEGTIDFGSNADGQLYSVGVTLEDRAANVSRFQFVLRYNRAPVITVKTDRLTVNPMEPILIEELVSVTDDEGTRAGDYPLTFVWTPQGGSEVLSWNGGAGSVLGDKGIRSAAFPQFPEQAQITEWAGTLTVTDSYGKTRYQALNILVENTREGVLYTDEYWSGPFEVTGVVRIPEGLTLTMDGSAVLVNGSLNSYGIIDSGIVVENGGTLLILNGQGGASSMGCALEGWNWKGVSVYGKIEGTALSVTGAERAFTLFPGGVMDISAFSLMGNITGLHLMGGTLEWAGGAIKDNSEYGIKEEHSGVYRFEGLEEGLSGNGVDYYRDGKTGNLPEGVSQEGVSQGEVTE